MLYIRFLELILPITESLYPLTYIFFVYAVYLTFLFYLCSYQKISRKKKKEFRKRRAQTKLIKLGFSITSYIILDILISPQLIKELSASLCHLK